MKAAYIDEFGGPDKLRVGERPPPERGGGKVLVRNRAAGVGPWDWKIMAGRFGQARLPMVPGLEIAGVVEQADPESGLKVGDEVYGTTGMSAGGRAEQATAEPGALAAKLPSLSFEEAVAVVVGGVTAYEGLVDRMKLRSGETVLITAASGGVGTMAVQVAAARGATVLGVASAGNLDYVRGLGAADVFDYNQPGWAEAVRQAFPDGVDALFDAAGTETGQEALRAVRPGGRAILVAFPTPSIEPSTGISGESFSAVVTRARLEALSDLIAAGKLRPVLSEVLPLDRVGEAVAHVQQGHTRGKVVLRIG